MVPDIENAIFTQCGGQRLPLGMAISTGRSPAETCMAEKRRLKNKNNRHQICWLKMVSIVLNQKRAGGNQ
jgi:hypothetical protein